MRAHSKFLAAIAVMVNLAAGRASADAVTDAQALNMTAGALALGSQLGNMGGAQNVSQAGVKEKEEQLQATKAVREAAAKLEQGRRGSWNEIFQNWQRYIDQLKAELKKLEDERKKKKEELEAEKRKPEPQRDQAKIARLEREIEELDKRIAALKRKIAEEEAQLARHRQLAAQAEQLKPQAEQNPQVADQIRALAGQASDQGVNRDIALFADAVQIAAAAKKDQEAIEKELEELKKMANTNQQNAQQLAAQQPASASTITGGSPQASYPVPSSIPVPPLAAGESGQESQKIGRPDFDRASQTGGMGNAAPRNVAGGPGNQSDITAKGPGAVPGGTSPRDSSEITGHGSDVEGGYNRPRAELAGFTATGNLGGGLPGGLPNAPGPNSAEEHLAALGGPDGSGTAVTGTGGTASTTGGSGSGSSYASGGSSGAGSAMGTLAATGFGLVSTAQAAEPPRGGQAGPDANDADGQSLFRRVRLVHNRCESFGCVRYRR